MIRVVLIQLEKILIYQYFMPVMLANYSSFNFVGLFIESNALARIFF